MRRAVAVLALVLAAAPHAVQAQRIDAGLDFWHVLGDPTLNRLLEAAVDANRDVAGARHRVAAARAVRNHAAFELAPVIGVSGGYSRQRLASSTLPGGGPLPDQDIWDAGVQMAWELDVFGRGRRTVQAAGLQADAAHADVRDVAVSVVAEVAQAYLQLQGALARLEVARQNAGNQERTLALTLDRLEAGRGTALDSERAQAQLSSTLAEIPALEALAASHRARIATLLGITSDALEIGDAGVSPNLPAELHVGSADALARARPDVRSAASRAAAGEALTSAARAAYLPRVSLGAVAGYTAPTFDALGNTGTPRYAVGPVISWPLLDLGRVRSNIAAARAQQAAAAAHLEQATLQARAEIETALVSYQSARRRLTHLQDAAAASDRATALARLRFEEGAADFLEVLDSERRQLETHDRLAAGRTEAASWLALVYRSTAGGSER